MPGPAPSAQASATTLAFKQLEGEFGARLGEYGTRDDIAIVWPTTGSPIVIAVESDRRSAHASSDDALITEATRTAIAAAS